MSRSSAHETRSLLRANGLRTLRRIATDGLPGSERRSRATSVGPIALKMPSRQTAPKSLRWKSCVVSSSGDTICPGDLLLRKSFSVVGIFGGFPAPLPSDTVPEGWNQIDCGLGSKEPGTLYHVRVRAIFEGMPMELCSASQKNQWVICTLRWARHPSKRTWRTIVSTSFTARSTMIGVSPPLASSKSCVGAAFPRSSCTDRNKALR